MKMCHLISSMLVIILAGILLSVKADAVAPLGSPGDLIQALESNITCGKPTMANADACRQIEEQILNSTVRIRIETWIVMPDESGYDIDFSEGHATVKDGRYLVTHNHFSVSLSIRPREGEPEAYGVVTLSNTDGETLFRGPLSDFELVWEDPETLVIAHKDDDFFEKLGFVSAEFKDWSSVPLATGIEVAQVDWNGATTRVDWAIVQEINVEDGVPWLVLSDDVTIGASGGGVFWQGVHIAHNWLLASQLSESGALIAVTKAALNSAQVAKEG